MTTKKLVGKYNKSEAPVKDKEGKMNYEIQEQRNIWVEHNEELLNKPASLGPTDIEAAHRHPCTCHYTNDRRDPDGRRTSRGSNGGRNCPNIIESCGKSDDVPEEWEPIEKYCF
ncbi:unnamed protein product [Schistosoma mattheei]|uniref:Uncharacterized protein n=1 Tax=Schistosoma mattheei TaxID=31246 RepID=A0A183PTS6_9TREM|nr:unnamed protein product [Schistosoma mattheei]